MVCLFYSACHDELDLTLSLLKDRTNLQAMQRQIANSNSI